MHSLIEIAAKEATLKRQAKVLNDIAKRKNKLITPEDIQKLEATLHTDAPPEVDVASNKKETCPLHHSRLPLAIRGIVNHLAKATDEEPNIKHIFSALLTLGAAVGKRAMWKNRGNEYSTALAAAIMAHSGDNKSGLHNQVELVAAPYVATDTPSSSTLEAFLEMYGQRVAVDPTHAPAKKLADIQHAKALGRQNRMGHFLVIDELRTWLLTMVPTMEQIRAGQALCKIIDNVDYTNSTVRNGCRVMAGTALTFLGFTQVDEWNNEMRTARFKIGGLAGRIIPVNPQSFDIREWGDDNYTDYGTHLGQINALLANNEITIQFGNDPKVDVVGEHKRQFLALDKVKEYTKNITESELNSMINKIVVQSAKVAAILAIASVAEQWQDNDTAFGGHVSNPTIDTVDPTPYLVLAFQLVGYSHLMSASYISATTEEGDRLDRLMTLIDRKGNQGATTRDLYKAMHLPARDIDGLIRMQMDAGVIREVEQETRQGTRFIYKKAI